VLQQNEPALFDRVFKYLDVACLSGLSHDRRWRTVGAALTDGPVRYAPALLGARPHTSIGLRMEQLPEACAPGEILGEMTQKPRGVRRAVGLPVAAGLATVKRWAGHEHHAPRFGVSQPGNVRHLGRLFRYLCSRASFPDDEQRPARPFLLETALMGGAYTINWFIEHFAGAADLTPGASAEAALEAAIQQVPPGSLGLMLVPYWNSVLNPYWDASASGIVVGWRGAHGRAHLYRSILEGIAFEQRLNTSVSNRPRSGGGIFYRGWGGAKSSAWLSDYGGHHGKPIYRSSTPEAAALALAYGGQRDWTVCRRAGGRSGHGHIESAPFEPDPTRSAFYSPLYEQVYRHLFPACSPIWIASPN